MSRNWLAVRAHLRGGAGPHKDKRRPGPQPEERTLMQVYNLLREESPPWGEIDKILQEEDLLWSDFVLLWEEHEERFNPFHPGA